MFELFTEEWIKKVDSKIQKKMKNFSWGENAPRGRLLVAYRVQFDEGEFAYHIDCGPSQSRVLIGVPDEPGVRNVVFTQSYNTALGIVQGTLNTHIEFLMGNIHVEGDVLVLEEYTEALTQIQSCFSEVSQEA